MAKIIVTHGVPAGGFDLLAEHEVIIPPARQVFDRDALQRLIADADAVVACGKLDGETIRLGKKLKIIANYGAGYDRVDIRQAAEQGVPVTNIPEATAEATAELAVGLMLSVARRIGELSLRLRSEPSHTLFGMGVEMGCTLRGRTLGVIGVGRIGSEVARVAKALGMRVIGYSRRGCDPAVAEPVGLNDLLAQADVVSLHCPLTDETRGLIGRAQLSVMKPGAMLINTSRGAVVDHDALADAIEQGRLAGAGLDVFPQEPEIPQRMIALPQVVLTPHVGTNTAQTRDEMARACARQILDALAGKRPRNIVNGV